MLKALLLATSLAFAGAAAAQYKWVDQNGKVQYGDTPPAGARISTVRPPSGPAQPEPAAEGKKDEKAPLTTAEKDAEFRKRQLEGEQNREKQAKAQQEADTKRENCARAQDYLRTLESGQRIARTNAKGEREVLEDAQIAQEVARARKSTQEWCK
jgi:hypothetical protein